MVLFVAVWSAFLCTEQDGAMSLMDPVLIGFAFVVGLGFWPVDWLGGVSDFRVASGGADGLVGGREGVVGGQLRSLSSVVCDFFALSRLVLSKGVSSSTMSESSMSWVLACGLGVGLGTP